MREAWSQPRSAAPEARAARQWLGLALGVLVLAGVFALAVVIGRMPPFDRLVTDPLFFKRCLVAHVNLALGAWFYSFVAGLLALLPGRRPMGTPARLSVGLAVAGIALILLGAWVPAARPLLSNYIPTIDHPVFRLGQALFAAGVLVSFLDPRLLPGGDAREAVFPMPDSARAGLYAVAVALLLAALTFVVTWLRLTPGLEPEVQHELLVWGGGHVLQLVCVIAMVTVWLLLLSSALGSSPVGGRTAVLLFAALLLPWSFSLALALQGPSTAAYRVGFTRLMQWGLFPVVSIFLILCGSALTRAWREGRIGRRELADPRISAFVASAALTLLGFGLGAAIRGSNTMVPAHYHASVGGVTVAFMAGTFLLLPLFGLSIRQPALRRAAAWQPALYGTGMALFAAGFALAGAYGMGRKIYGAEQATRGLAETIGLGMMGIGGLVAVAGGVVFLIVIGSAWWRGTERERRQRIELSGGSRRYRYGA
jgi:hypothetical protein